MLWIQVTLCWCYSSDTHAHLHTWHEWHTWKFLHTWEFPHLALLADKSYMWMSQHLPSLPI